MKLGLGFVPIVKQEIFVHHICVLILLGLPCTRRWPQRGRMLHFELSVWLSLALLAISSRDSACKMYFSQEQTISQEGMSCPTPSSRSEPDTLLLVFRSRNLPQLDCFCNSSQETDMIPFPWPSHVSHAWILWSGRDGETPDFGKPPRLCKR